MSAPQPEFTMKELVAAWRHVETSLKAKKKAYENSVKEEKAMIEVLEQEIMSLLDQQQTNGVTLRRAKDNPDDIGGTVYMTHLMRPRVEDKQRFFTYILDSGSTDLLTAKVATDAVRAYLTEHEAPPPGVTIDTVRNLNFRAAK